MKIKLYLREWFYNAGIIGFLRILKESEININKIMRDNYIEVETEDLRNFNKHYFNYFYNIYDISKKIRARVDDSYEKIEYILKKMETSDKNEKKDELNKDLKNQKKYIKDTIKYQLDKIKKLDEILYNSINENWNMIDSIKELSDTQKLREIFDNIIKYFSIPNINDRLTLNLFKSVLSKNFYGQQSFLNVVKSNLTLSEQKELMYKDYISNIVETGYLNDVLNSEYSIEQINKYCNKMKDDPLISKDVQSIYSNILKKYIDKGKSLLDIQEYIKNNSLSDCHMCENENVLTNEYTEGNFVPLAISSDNMKNFFWNQNARFPICDMCKLMLFCIPAGVTSIIKIEKQNEKGKTTYKEKEIYSFVNNDTSVKYLLDYNDSFRNMSKVDKSAYNPYSEIILDIIEQSKRISTYQLQNIFFVEFEAEYLAYSRMEYFNISKYVLIFLEKYSKNTISKIIDYKFKLQLVECIIKNKSIVRIINDRLRIALKENNYNEGYKCYIATKANLILNLLKKGENDMDNEIKKQNGNVNVLYNIGKEIRRECTKENSENKLTSYAYRMLNSIKANNKKEFMDTVIRLHLFMDKDVSPIFLQVMQDGKLDFESIGHSFVSGLISNLNDLKNNGTDDNINNNLDVNEGGIENE